MSSVTQVITGNHRFFFDGPKPPREKYLRGTLSSTCFFCYAMSQHKHVGKVGIVRRKTFWKTFTLFCFVSSAGKSGTDTQVFLRCRSHWTGWESGGLGHSPGSIGNM